jgi:hypothetical protein
MLALLLFGLVVLALLWVPLMLLRVAFKVLFGLVFLPLKLVGVLFQVVFGVLGVVLRVLLSGAGLILALVAVVGLVILIPLIPFLLVGLVLWLVTRRQRPHGMLRTVG